MCTIKLTIMGFIFRRGPRPWRWASPLLSLPLAALWLAPHAARADAGAGESGILVIDNRSYAESPVIALDNRFALADLDRDGDVDLGDFAAFAMCFSGPAVVYADDCLTADLDHDCDVDLDDFGRFQRGFSGENVPAVPSEERDRIGPPTPFGALSPQQAIKPE